jgi:hypothetical protein
MLLATLKRFGRCIRSRPSGRAASFPSPGTEVQERGVAEVVDLVEEAMEPVQMSYCPMAISAWNLHILFLFDFVYLIVDAALFERQYFRFVFSEINRVPVVSLGLDVVRLEHRPLKQ